MGKQSRKGQQRAASHPHHKTGEGTHHHHHLYSGSHTSHHSSASSSFNETDAATDAAKDVATDVATDTATDATTGAATDATTGAATDAAPPTTDQPDASPPVESAVSGDAEQETETAETASPVPKSDKNDSSVIKADKRASQDDDDDDNGDDWIQINESDAPPVASKKQLIVLSSLKSLDRQVTRQQFLALSILDANAVPYQVLDGSDPAVASKRARLWQLPGAKLGVYPQFFVVQPGSDVAAQDIDEGGEKDKGGDSESGSSSSRWAQTTFWGDFARFEDVNETPGAIAKEFGGTPPTPVASTPAAATTRSVPSDPSPVESQTKDKEAEGAGDDNEGAEAKSRSHNALVLSLFTCLILAIPVFLLGKDDNGRLKLLASIEKKMVQLWKSLSHTQSRQLDDSLTGIEKNLSLWDNPLDDAEFLSDVFGGSQDRKEARLQNPKKMMTKPAWKDPFDWFDGDSHDEQLQAFFRNVARFLQHQQPDKPQKRGKQKDEDIEDRQLAQMMTHFLAQKTESAAEQKSMGEIISMLTDSSAEVFRQLNQTLGHVGLERFNLLQFLYYMDHEESRKNSVWKRKQHRFQPELPLEAALQLHDGLYLSQLAYAPSCSEIHNRIQRFKGGLWVLRNCTTDSSVLQPAHFLLVRKVNTAGTLKDQLQQAWATTTASFRRRAAADWSWLAGPLQHVPPRRQQIEVAIVVRGSKEIFDFLTDGMLLASEYQDGKAHDGILKAAQWLEQHYRDDLKHFYRLSKTVYGNRQPMKLWLLGHSLGGGVSALGAMEFRSPNYAAWLDAEALGFGTPSLVSPHLSERYKDYITTVVNDADLVPRTSGLTMAKTWLDIVAFNWTEAALEDYDQLISLIRSDKNLEHDFFGRKGHEWLDDSARDIRRWLEKWFDENVAPWLKDLPGKELNQSLEVELVPPGECIHLYRDGVSFQGSYVDCSFFDDFETVRHMVDDHLIPPGYYKAILSFVRDKLSNDTFVFEDSIPEIDYP